MKPTGLRKNTQDADNAVELSFRDKHSHISRIIIVISLILFVGALVLLTIILKKNLSKNDELTQIIGLAEAQNGNIAIAQDTYNIMKELRKTLELPPDELPILATISDVSKLAGQPIFNYAANGDQILFYTKAQRLYVFRPSTKSLVTQGPFTMPVVSPQQSQPNNFEQPLPSTSTREAELLP